MDLSAVSVGRRAATPRRRADTRQLVVSALTYPWLFRLPQVYRADALCPTRPRKMAAGHGRSDISPGWRTNILRKGETVLKGSRKARLIKKVGAAGVLTVAALAFPAVASAHHATLD